MAWENILEGLASNAIFLALLALAGWVAYLVRRRRPLITFFGLRPSRRIVIYTSTLQVPPFTSAGVDGQQRSFHGPALPQYEAIAAAALQRIFSAAAPGVSGISGWLRHLRFVDIEAVVEASPASPDDVTRSDSFIAIGSSAYNAASARIENDLPGKGRFVANMGSIEVAGRSYQGDFALLERVTDPSSEQTAFYAAGHGVRDTAGAVNYLRTNWRRLAKEHKGGDFALVLKVNADGSNADVVSVGAS